MPFRDFWPAYLRVHSRRATRLAHYLATVIGLGGVALAAVTGTTWIAPAAICAAYAIAVGSHRVFEGGRSMVRVNPVWGALADLRMCWLALTGRLAAELDRGRVPPSGGSEITR